EEEAGSGKTERLVGNTSGVSRAKAGRSGGISGSCSGLEPNPAYPPNPWFSGDPATGVCTPGTTDCPDADAGACPSISATLSSIHCNIDIRPRRRVNKQRCGGWARCYRLSEKLYFTLSPVGRSIYDGA